jgi:chromosome segregation protein
MEFEMNENRENLKQLDSKLETTRNDFHQAEHLLIEGQNKVQGIVRSITEREMELIETEQSIREKQKQSQALDLDLSSKNAVLDAIKQALVDTEIKSTEQQSQLDQAHESLELLRSQAAELEDTLIGLSGQKMEADASIAFAASQTKDLRNLIEALENEKTSIVRLLETKKSQLDTTLQERVQLETANRKLIESNDQEVRAIHDLQSRRDELTKHVSDLDHELSLNKENASQLQTQIEVSSGQIAQLEQNRREWMDKESTIIQQVTRLHSELENLESQQRQASQDLEIMLIQTQNTPKWVPNRRWVKLLPKRSESIQPTTMELAQEILEDIAELAILDDEMVGQDVPANESDIIDSSPSQPSEDPWSVVLN